MNDVYLAILPVNIFKLLDGQQDVSHVESADLDIHASLQQSSYYYLEGLYFFILIQKNAAFFFKVLLIRV